MKTAPDPRVGLLRAAARTTGAAADEAAARGGGDASTGAPRKGRKKTVKGKKRKGHAAHDDPDSDDDDAETARDPNPGLPNPDPGSSLAIVPVADQTLGPSKREYAAVKESRYPMPNFAGMNLVTEEEYARLEKEASAKLVSPPVKSSFKYKSAVSARPAMLAAPPVSV